MGSTFASGERFAAARRFLSLVRRDTRCFSAQFSHRVCPGIASWSQLRQIPRLFALWYLTLHLSRSRCRFCSGVSGVILGRHSFGGVDFFAGLARRALVAFPSLAGLLRFLCCIWKECWATYLFTRLISTRRRGDWWLPRWSPARSAGRRPRRAVPRRCGTVARSPVRR